MPFKVFKLLKPFELLSNSIFDLLTVPNFESNRFMIGSTFRHDNLITNRICEGLPLTNHDRVILPAI